MVTETNEFKLISESFPHIGKAISLTWGSKEFVEYTGRLFFDTRNGERQGFPYNVLSALHKLCELHDKTFPQFVESKENDVPFTFGSNRS